MQVRAGRLFREISAYRVYFFFFLESYFTYKCRCSASTHLWLNTDTDTKKVQERSNRWVISKQLSGISYKGLIGIFLLIRVHFLRKHKFYLYLEKLLR